MIAWGRGRRRSLHQRLLAISTATSLVGLLAVATLMYVTSNIRADLSRATNAVLEEQEIADRVISGVMRQLVTITSATDQGLAPLRSEFEAASAQVYEGLRAYLFRDLTIEERLQIEAVKEEHQLLEVTAMRAAESGSLSDSSSRLALRREAMGHALRLLDAMNGFLRLREVDLKAVAAEQSRSFRTLWLGGGASLLALGAVIGLLLSHFIRRRVVAPLHTLAEAVTRFGEGDLDVRAPTGMDREFHDLAVAFNRMSERLALAQGTLTTRNVELEQALQSVREARDELVQTEKLGAVGRMSAGLAHELNNPLAAVLGYAELLAAELHDGTQMTAEHAMSHVEPLVREATRARQLVRSLLQFSRRASDETGPVSLADAMGVVTDLRRGSFEQDQLRLVVEPMPARPVLAEQQRLQGVFLNIVNNAQQAMRGRQHGMLRIHNEVSDDRVTLYFDDEGPGLSQPDRVFEPFYTTKDPGEGTGLGLALTNRFIDSFGGEVRAGNRAEGGARITVVLRFAEDEVPAARETERSASSAASRARVVLVVDDEPDLRRLAGKVLRRLGVEVIEAGSVATAREVLRQRDVDVVVSDVRMPGESGAALFEWIQREQPALADRFLFVTGDADADELSDVPFDRLEAVLHKPFTLQDLTDRVRAMLDRLKD